MTTLTDSQHKFLVQAARDRFLHANLTDVEVRSGYFLRVAAAFLVARCIRVTDGYKVRYFYRSTTHKFTYPETLGD
jgi:hypothetical protein